MKKHKIVQDIARKTMDYLESNIACEMTEYEIKKMAEDFMLLCGIEGFWYYNIGALVLIDENSIFSISGKNYVASKTKKVKDGSIITIDLSPEIKGIWGDFARTFIYKNSFHLYKNELDAQCFLHEYFKSISTPSISCGEIYSLINEKIISMGLVNLDFKKNIGHSITSDKDKRIYLEKGEKRTLRELAIFTFEPHISKDMKYGFKYENIYYFDKNNIIQEL